jgi:predicted RNA-binding protein with PUA-like domain
MQYWLMKTEPNVFSFEDLKNCKNQTEPWDGIRNYQARNFMRDKMKEGDLVLFYHSRCDPPGIVGIAEIVSNPYPDHTAWNPKSNYYDPKSSPENPRWVMVDVRYKTDFKNPVTLSDLKADKRLENMKVVQRGQRLSIQPVEKAHFNIVCEMGGL